MADVRVPSRCVHPRLTQSHHRPIDRFRGLCQFFGMAKKQAPKDKGAALSARSWRRSQAGRGHRRPDCGRASRSAHLHRHPHPLDHPGAQGPYKNRTDGTMSISRWWRASRWAGARSKACSRCFTAIPSRRWWPLYGKREDVTEDELDRLAMLIDKARRRGGRADMLLMRGLVLPPRCSCRCSPGHHAAAAALRCHPPSGLAGAVGRCLRRCRCWRWWCCRQGMLPQAADTAPATPVRGGGGPWLELAMWCRC